MIRMHSDIIVFASSFTMFGASAIATPPMPGSGDKFPYLEASSQAAVAPAMPRTLGSLAVQAVQGSKDGSPIGAVPIEIQLLHRGTVVDTRSAQLDEHGVVVLDDIPVSMGVQPLVRVQHAGLTYQLTGGLMDSSHPEQKLEVICYELTEQQPQWTIAMRHVMIAQSAEGLKVTEVIVIDNPDDRTWVGQTLGAAVKHKRVTTEFALPEGASNVSLGRGFHDWCCSTLADGRICNHLPLMPGRTEMVYGYVVAGQDGKATIDIAAPARIDHLMVLTPESMITESSSGLELGGTQTMGETSVRHYSASGLQPGAQASITMAGLTSAVAANPKDSATQIKIIAAVGAGLLLLLGLGVILIRKPGREGKVAISSF